jgi:NAD(P)-dependent dehydrogenase (short-subunit alcohol dehydrogenase family)
MSYFAGKRILITGAGSGLGRRMALSMAREGGGIIAWDINAEALEKVLSELKMASGSAHVGMVCDVSSSEAVYQAADAVRGRPVRRTSSSTTPDWSVENPSWSAVMRKYSVPWASIPWHCSGRPRHFCRR